MPLRLSRVRIFSYNWRLAWVVVPAFIWGWLGLTVVTGAMLQPDGPGGPPPLGLKLERGLHGIHIPGILRGVREDEDALVLIMELPHGAREVLEQRQANGSNTARPSEPGLLPGLDHLLDGTGQEPREPGGWDRDRPEGQNPGPPRFEDERYKEKGMRRLNGEAGRRPAIIPDMPKLPEGVRIEIVEPGEMPGGRPEIDLLEDSRVIDLPQGDKLIVGQHWAVRVGREGARLLKRPAGGAEKFRKWIHKLGEERPGRGPGRGRPEDGERRGPLGPEGREDRQDRRRDRRDERRGGQGEHQGQGDQKPGGPPPGERPPGNRPPGENPPQHPPDGPPDGQPPGDKPPHDGPPQDRPPQDRPPQDRPPQDRPPQDRPPQDRPPQDRPPQDGKPPQGPPPGGPGGSR